MHRLYGDIIAECREYKKCSVTRPKYKLPPNVHAAVGGIDAYYGQYPHMVGCELI